MTFCSLGHFGQNIMKCWHDVPSQNVLTHVTTAIHGIETRKGKEKKKCLHSGMKSQDLSDNDSILVSYIMIPVLRAVQKLCQITIGMEALYLAVEQLQEIVLKEKKELVI